MVVFEVVSRLGKRIRLTEIQWAHMRSRHPELVEHLGKMKATLVELGLFHRSATKRSPRGLGLAKQSPLAVSYT